MEVFGIIGGLASVAIIAIGLFLRERRKAKCEAQNSGRKKGLMEAADKELRSDISEIKGMIMSNETGLPALHREIGAFRRHCAEVSTNLTTRMSRAEEDIKGLAKKRR